MEKKETHTYDDLIRQFFILLEYDVYHASEEEPAEFSLERRAWRWVVLAPFMQKIEIINSRNEIRRFKPPISAEDAGRFTLETIIDYTLYEYILSDKDVQSRFKNLLDSRETKE